MRINEYGIDTGDTEAASRQLVRLLYKEDYALRILKTSLRRSNVYYTQEDLEDIIQDVFVVVQSKIVKYQLGIVPDGYMFKFITFAISDVMYRRMEKQMAKKRQERKRTALPEDFQLASQTALDEYDALINSIAIEQTIGNKKTWMEIVAEKTGQVHLNPDVSYQSRSGKLPFIRNHLKDVLL